ncbi:hypothetical protein ACIP6I_05630 [Streptomyces anulatus]|uniref:hypothetical protein n=1 Tax=Streptomyces anulatus TaxID=1892 RepID=UPI001C280504|nr:hypothetical protein [Streptomyces anulatus]
MPGHQQQEGHPHDFVVVEGVAALGDRRQGGEQPVVRLGVLALHQVGHVGVQLLESSL